MGVVSALGKMPVSTAAIGLAAAPVLAPIAKAINPLDDPLRTAVKDEVENRERNRIIALRAMRLRRDMANNTARLASLDPRLYNEILAGRRLPKGSVVFGGRPRTDLMELLAEKMSTGEIGPPQDEQPF